MSQEFDTEALSTAEALQMQILTTQALMDVLEREIGDRPRFMGISSTPATS